MKLRALSDEPDVVLWTQATACLQRVNISTRVTGLSHEIRGHLSYLWPSFQFSQLNMSSHQTYCSQTFRDGLV